MSNQNTAENIFRFVHIRPASADSVPTSDGLSVAAPLARELSNTELQERKKRATAFLREGTRMRDLLASETAGRLIQVATSVANMNGSVDDLRYATAEIGTSGLPSLRDAASDLLLAVVLSKHVPVGYLDVERLFRAASAVLEASVPGSLRLRRYLRRAIALPETFAPPAAGAAAHVATPRSQAVRPSARAANPERME